MAAMHKHLEWSAKQGTTEKAEKGSQGRLIPGARFHQSPGSSGCSSRTLHACSVLISAAHHWRSPERQERHLQLWTIRTRSCLKAASDSQGCELPRWSQPIPQGSCENPGPVHTRRPGSSHSSAHKLHTVLQINYWPQVGLGHTNLKLFVLEKPLKNGPQMW